jgi:hypothetical protein
MRCPILAVILLAAPACADVLDPLEWFLNHAPEKDDTQGQSTRWTFRSDTDHNGDLLIGSNSNVACEPGFANWVTPAGDYGFVPSVGPRLSPDEGRDQSNSSYKPEYDGLLFLPGNPNLGNAVAVFTAPQDMTLPAMTLKAEIVYSGSDGVRVSVKTRIANQTKVWLDQAAVPANDPGYQEWSLFTQNAPTLGQGDKLWIEVNAGPNNNTAADWTNISLTSGAACYADCDGDGELSLFDFLCFTNNFNAQDPAADCDATGTFDLFDFLCFANAFNAGC